MLARRLEEAARPLARQASQLALGTAFDSWPTRRTAINPREKNNNQLFVRRTLTQSSPASAGFPCEMMAEPRESRQAPTGRPYRACPVQRLVRAPYEKLRTAKEAKPRSCHLARATPGRLRRRVAYDPMNQSRSSWPTLARWARGESAWRDTLRAARDPRCRSGGGPARPASGETGSLSA